MEFAVTVGAFGASGISMWAFNMTVPSMRRATVPAWLRFSTTFLIIHAYVYNEAPMWAPKRSISPHSGL